MVKYKVLYEVSGEIEIDIELGDIKAYQDFERIFNDRIGFSEDDLYENLNHDFKIKAITLAEQE